MFKVRVVFIVFVLLINLAKAHVCDDVLRYDPIEIRPEKQRIEVVKTGEFKIFIKNNYVGPIHNVKLIVPENIFNIEVSPTLIGKIEPRQEVYFLVKITIPKKIEPGAYPLVMKVDALEFEVTRDVHVTLEVGRREEATIEIIPEDVPVATSVFPSLVEIEPTQVTEIRVYVRNGHTEPIHNIRLFVNESRFKINITPELIEEIKPGDRTYFIVNLFIPEGIEYGDYMLAMELGADEFTVKRGLGAIIRVGKVREEITYIYLLLILFFTFLLVWRWLALKRSKQLLGQ